MVNDREAIILAGGLGTRVRHVAPGLPKPLAPVAGRPFLELLLTVLARKGFRRVVLSLGYLSGKIVAHVGDRFAGMEVRYQIEDTPLGTGGAVRQALERCAADHVFVFNGDTFLDVEASEVEGQWRERRFPIIVALEVPDTARYGRVDASRGRVIRFREKGAAGPGLINAGCYVIPKGLLDRYPRGAAFSLEADFLARQVTRQRFDVFVTKGQFLDIGTPEDLERAQTELAWVTRQRPGRG